MDAAFRVFDKDGSGAVDFQELCYALSLCFLSGQEERLRFLFNMFDTSGRGIMSQAQAAALLQAALKSLQQFGLAPTSAHGDDSERLWLEQQLAALQDCMPPPTGGAPSAPPGSVTFDAFRQWAGRGPAADHMLKAFDVLPSPRKQRLAVKVALGCAGFRSADVWYVLPSAWWRQWAQFTAFHEVDDRRELAEELLPHWGGGLSQAPPGEEGGDAPPLNPATNIPPGCGVPFVHEAYRVVHELPAAGGAKEAKEEEEEEEEVPAPVLVPSSPPVRQVSVGHGGVMPGPIDCSALLAPAPSASASPRQLSAELRSGLVPDYDFVLLPATVWRLFVRWYGLAKGVGAVPRRVLCDAGALSVELYPPVLTFLLAAHDGRPDPRTEVSVMVSRSTPLAALHALARQEFGYHPLPLPSDPPHAGALVQALRTTCHAQPAAQPVQLFLQEFSPCPWQAAEPLALQVASPTKPPSVTARTISSSDVARLRSRLWLALPQADAADNPPWRRLHPCPSTVLQQHIAALAQGAATDCLPALHAGNTLIALAGLGSGSRLMLEVAMPPQAHARDLHAKAFSASFGWFWPCALLDCEAWAEDDRPGMVPASQEVHIPLPRIPVPDTAEGVDEGAPARCPAGTLLLHAPVSSWRYGRWAAPWMSHPLPPQKSPGLLAGGSVKVFEVLPPPLPVPQAVDVLVDGHWQAGNVAAAPSEAASQSPWRLKVLGSKRGSPATEVHVPPEQVHVAPPGWRCATPPFTGKRWGPGHSKHGATVARAWRAVLQREDTLKGGAKRAKGKAWWEGLWWARRPRKSAARERPKKVGPGRETTTTAQFADTAEGSATQVVPLASAHTAHHRRAGTGHGGKDGESVQSSVHSAVSGASAAKAGSVDTAASSRKEAGTVGSTGSAAGGEESGRASGCAGFSQQPTDVLEEHAWRAGTDPDLWGFDTAAFLWGEEGHLAAEGEEAPSAEALVLRSRWWVVRVAEEWAVHVDMAPAMQSSSEGSAKLLAATTSNSATAAVAQGELWGTGGGVVLQGNHRQSRLLGGATGLANLGNTCYMNVILQCLAATPLLNRFMSSGNFRPEVNSSNPLGSGGRLARTLGELLHVMWAGTHKWVSPSSFKEALTTAKPWFAGREQHDAMELLGQLLDCLHEDLSRVSTKQREEVLAARRRVSKSQSQAKQPTEGSKGTARAGGAPPPAFEGAHVTSEMTSVPRDAEGGRATPSHPGIASAGGPPHSVERVASNTEAKDAPPTLTFDAAAPDIPDEQGESKHAYDSKEDEPSPRPPPSGRGPSLAHPLDVSACVHDAVGHRLGRSGSLASVDLSGVPPSSDGQGHEPVGVALGEYSLLKSDPATLLSHAEAANQSWVQHLLLNRSAVVDLFQGQYQARTVCQHCRYESVSFQPFMSLTLPIPTFSTMPLEVVVHSLSCGWQGGAVRPAGAWVSPPTQGPAMQAEKSLDVGGDSQGFEAIAPALRCPVPMRGALLIRKHVTFADVVRQLQGAVCSTPATVPGDTGGLLDFQLAEVRSHRFLRVFRSSSTVSPSLKLRDDAILSFDACEYTPPSQRLQGEEQALPPKLVAIHKPLHWCQVAGHPALPYPRQGPGSCLVGSSTGHAAGQSAEASSKGLQHCAVGDRVDAKDSQGAWYPSTVVNRWSDAGQTLVRIHFDYFPVKWDETFVLPSTKLAVLGRHTASACLLPQPFAVPEAGLSVAFASPAASTTAPSKKTRLQEALVAVQVVHRFPQHRTVRRTTRREVEIVTPTKVSLPDRSGAAKSETRTSRTTQWQDVTEDQRVTSWHCFGQPLMLHFSSLLSSCQVAELVAAHAGRFMASNISEAPAQQLADGTAATLASYSSEYLSLMKTVAAASSVEGQGSRGDAQALSTSDHADDQQQNRSVLTAVELRLECVKRLFSHAPFELRLVSERDLASSSKGTLLKPSVQPLNLLKGSSIAVHWHDPAAYSAVAPLFSCVGLVPAPPCLLSKHLVQRLRASGVLGQASASEDECTALAAAAHQAVRGNLAVGAAAVPVVLLGSTQQVLPEGVELAPAVVTALQSAEGGEAANHSLLPSCGSTAVHASLGQVRALQAHRLQRRAGEGAPPSPACESTPSQWVGNPATTISLESCFDAFTKVEKLPAWRCEQCSETGGVRSTALWRLPDILVLQLARFRFNEFEREKLHHPIAFPVDHMNVAPWVAPAPLLHEALSGEAAGNGPPQRLAQSSSTASAPSFAEMPTDFTNMLRAEYDLYAVVHHHGQMGSGHYTAVCKVPLSGDGGDGDAWLRFDDRHVEAAPDPSECISPSAAYVLFYRRRHLSPRNVISLKGAGIA